MSKIFKQPEMLHKHYVYDFSKHFHGLIGIDLITKLTARLDFKTGKFIIPGTEIQMFVQGKPLQETMLSETNGKITISPFTEQIITLKTNYQNNTELVLPSQILNCNVEIPSGISTVNNSYFKFLAINPTEFETEIDLDEIEYYPQQIEINNLEFNQEPLDNNSFKNFDNLQKANLKNLRLQHLNQEEYNAIRKLCFEYRDIMYCEGIPLSFTNTTKHHIKTTDNIPIYTKSYRYPQVHKEEISRQMNEMQQQGIIRPSKSPWSSPLWIVPKKLDASGQRKWRIVIDYRKLNSKTIDDKFPIPNITDIFDKLGKCNYFTTLDLASGFHQIEMAEEDIEKTAFNTDKGHYEYIRMPFGLKNAPATFQRAMNNVLNGLSDICTVYLDDIIIFSTSLDEHILNLRKVFDRLRETNFKIQLDKSEFLKQETNYLGHVITRDGIMPNPDKIKAILKFPIPKTTKEIKSFLGLTGYYRKFIRNYAKLTKPLTLCLKKGSVIKHDEDFIKSFNTCKQLLTNAPILQYPDFSKPFILTTDASNESLGAILSQGNPGSDLPIAYASRTLNDAERNYSVIERELLGCVWACKYFRPYLYGRKFTIYTDHRPLQWLHQLKEPNSKLMRWRIRLEEFDYDVVYKKGKLNTNADALSRIKIDKVDIHPLDTSSLVVNHDNEISQLLDDINDIIENNERQLNTPPGIDTSENIELPDSPRNLDLDLILPVEERDEARNNTTLHSNQSDEPQNSIEISEDPINKEKRQIIIKIQENPKPSISNKIDNKHITKVYLPVNYQSRDLKDILKNYTIGNETFHLFSKRQEIYRELAILYTSLFNNNAPRIIWHTSRVKDLHDMDRIKEAIKNYHEGKTNHRGAHETYLKLKDKYYFKTMLKTIQDYINKCEVCQKGKYPRHPPVMPLNITPTSSTPFEHLYMDTLSIEGKIFLTVIDAFSKFAYVTKLLSKEATQITQEVLKFFALYNIPKRITLDNGGEFQNMTFREMAKVYNIDLHFITPNHPNANGQIERFHSTLLEHIRIFKLNKKHNKTPIEQLILLSLIAYHSTIHINTGKTPQEIIYGNRHTTLNQNITMNNLINDHIEDMKLIHQQVKDHNLQNKTKYIEYHNRNTQDPQTMFKIGQTVYLKNSRSQRSKLASRYEGPYTLTKLNADNTALIVDKNRNLPAFKTHVSNLRTTKSDIITDP